MIESDKTLNVIQHLFDKDFENKTCVHCKSPMPTFVSINNAIIICQQCAEKHKTLGYNISYVRELKDVSKKYELDDMSIEDKFHTKISEYYRLLVNQNII